MHCKEMAKMELNICRIAKTSHFKFKEIKHGKLNSGLNFEPEIEVW